MNEQRPSRRFDHAIEELRQEWHEAPTAEKAAMLSTIYQGYSQRFLSDNTRIWATAATMIPLSLGAFVVLASIDRPSRFQIVILPLTGWLLMSIWLVIAENYRSLQDVSYQWLRAVERIWGFDEALPVQRLSWLTGRRRVQQMRFVLWWIVTAGAAAVILFWPGGFCC